MLKIHFYGKLRKFGKDSSPTGNSILELSHIEDETILQLLDRIGILPEETGELFVNRKLADFDTIISKDSSRIAIFGRGMHLIDGGQHIKGHGLINTRRKKIDYY